MTGKYVLPHPTIEARPTRSPVARWAPLAMLLGTLTLIIYSASTDDAGLAITHIRTLRTVWPVGIQRRPGQVAMSTPAGSSIDLATNEYWASNFSPDVLELAKVPKAATDPDIKDVAGRLRRLAMELPQQWPRNYIYEVNAQRVTVESLLRLAECIEHGNCKAGETQVIIAGDLHFGNSLSGGVSGEDIWARSSIDAFRELGHTILFAYDTLEVLQIYQAIPELVSTVLLDIYQIKQCSQLGVPRLLETDDIRRGATTLSRSNAMSILQELGTLQDDQDEDYFGEEFGNSRDRAVWGWPKVRGEERQVAPGCVRRKGFEDGIPIYKIFAFHFWNGPEHPLGEAWTLSPEPYSTQPSTRNKQRHNFYLGYSVEKWCSRHQLAPDAPRLNRAFVFAKDKKFFERDHFVFWNENRTFETLSDKTGLHFVAAAGDKASALPESALTNLGRMPVDVFYKELAQSKALIGVGKPPLSPTPYDALCLGVPFINPILQWDRQNPQNREEWRLQQDGLLQVQAPHVYHVFAGDHEGLEMAINDARAHPFGSFIVPSMTTSANRARHKALVSLNWRPLAEQRMQELGQTGLRVPYVL